MVVSQTHIHKHIDITTIFENKVEDVIDIFKVVYLKDKDYRSINRVKKEHIFLILDKYTLKVIFFQIYDRFIFTLLILIFIYEYLL